MRTPISGEVELTTLQEKVVDLLMERGELTLAQLKSATGQPLTSVVPDLVGKGVLLREMRPDDKVPGMRMLRFVRVLDADAEIPERAPKQRAVMEEIVQLYRAAQEHETDLIPVQDLQQVIDVDGADAGGPCRREARSRLSSSRRGRHRNRARRSRRR